ncbi:hypothetical protein C1H76_2894 [Elsinoe australis]|uniref:Rhodopsin domain-containing protein n=1 Tax=Elsinoe australis TaxID=40998 RepID=A0A4U7B5W3_9PEZI|nr:hypothetical protein C1H76_2894 [Elsinoe australis]
MAWVINGTPELQEKSRYLEVVTACLVCTVFLLAANLLRLYVRIWRLHAYAIDDTLTLIASVCAIVYGAFAISQTRLGLGLPPPDRPRENAPDYALQNIVARPFYNFATTLFKVGLCFTFLRFIHGCNHRHYTRVIRITMVACIMHGTGYLMAIMFNCIPVQKSWRPTTKGTCLPISTFYYGTGISTIVMDVWLFALPVPLIARLQMTTTKKIELIGPILLSFLTLVCSIMRVIATADVLKYGDATNFIIWGVVEAHVGIILTTLPQLRPLFRGQQGGGSGSRSTAIYGTSDEPNQPPSAHEDRIARQGSRDPILEQHELSL